MAQHNTPGLNRRAFLQTAALAGGAITAAAGASGAENAPPPPPHRYWIYGCGDNPAETAKAMREQGFNVVVGGDAKAIEAVNSAGMESWLCGGAFGAGEQETEHLALDITGKPQVWFGSGSPNSPVIRERNLKSYEQMAATPGVAGVLVDGCRFASPASGLMAFLTDFSAHSERKAAELGFDFARMKADVTALHGALTTPPAQAAKSLPWRRSAAGVLEWLSARPGVLEWFRFRRVCTTEHFKDIAAVLHGAGKRMGVYIFTPSLAPLVGQSYADLSEFVDVFCPMIYRLYPDRPGIACLNWELSILPEELGLSGAPEEEAVMGACLNLLGLDKAIASRRVRHIQAAVPPQAVGHETAMARALLPEDRELAPIVYIDDPLMGETADEVRRAGANGIAFFLYKENWKALTGPAFTG